MSGRAKLYLVTLIAVAATITLMVLWAREYWAWFTLPQPAVPKWLQTEKPSFGYAWLAYLAALPGFVAFLGAIWAWIDFDISRKVYDDTGRWPETLLNIFGH